MCLQTIATLSAALVLAAALTGPVQATDYDYASIAQRHADAALTPEELAKARMRGECLVGLKKLNFKRRTDFDAVSEWTNYRSLSLLEQFPPCEVLVIMEIARQAVIDEEASESEQEQE